eukprot:1158328-Pelagomonas_calceolata.AAC.4
MNCTTESSAVVILGFKEVTVRTHAHPGNPAPLQFTKLTVDVGDYGGLLRTIAWVLTGSETCVHHAAISTNQDEMAHK